MLHMAMIATIAGTVKHFPACLSYDEGHFHSEFVFCGIMFQIGSVGTNLNLELEFPLTRLKMQKCKRHVV